MLFFRRFITCFAFLFTLTACNASKESSTAPTQKPEPAGGLPRLDAQKKVPARIFYHGNIRSRVFHAPSCPQYNCKHCRALFSSPYQAKRHGFRPHTCVR